MNKQLQLVADIELKKEQKLAIQYSEAQQAVVAQKDRLKGLEQYRLEYLKNMQTSGQKGVSSHQMSRLHAFISQLDKACQQQREKIKQAEKVSEQRRALWLNQQRKRKSIDTVLEKQKQQLIIKQNKDEQKMFDEFTTNMTVRRMLAGY